MSTSPLPHTLAPLRVRIPIRTGFYAHPNATLDPDAPNAPNIVENNTTTEPAPAPSILNNTHPHRRRRYNNKKQKQPRQQQHQPQQPKQTRRATRQNPVAGDENKVTQAAGKAVGTTKNAGLALKGKVPAAGATGGVALASKGNNAVVGARKRTALADSSNKVTQVGLKGKIGTGAAKPAVVAEKPAAAAVQQRPIARRTRSSLGAAQDADGDALMDDAAANDTRPIKSLRSNSSSVNTRGLPLSGVPSNIPRKSSVSTNATAAGSSKNDGLRKSTVKAEPVVEEVVKKSSKNAGLRVKREIQEVVTEDENPSSVREEGEDDNGAAVGGRRRSKRLRASEPENGPLATVDNAKVASIVGRVVRESSAGAEVYEDSDYDDDDEDAKDAGWEDLDIGDEEDPLMVSEYVKEIHAYMKELEVRSMPNPKYMNKQSEVTWGARSILVDWLIECHGKFRLLPETIFLAQNIIDRFLSIRTVALVKFQLVGLVALFIAAKYEEVVCPSVSSFLHMSDGHYSDEEILSAERYVLKQIDFNLSYPNPINFLRRISKADGYDIQTRTVAKYFLEMSIVERKLMASPPSMIAAASMWLARKVLDRGEWHANLVHYSTYSQLEILPTAQIMLDYILRRSQQPGEPLEHPHFHRKYCAKKFYRAAEIVREWAEARYLYKRAELKASGVASLFPALEGSGRLEEWEEEGEVAPELDFE